MKVAVITPYYKEDIEIIQQCHQSVLDQSIQCLHVIVADGFPNSEIFEWNCDHVVLPNSHNDIGSTPRLIGCYHAIGLGFDAVAFLDADNWYRKDHIETLVNLHEKTHASFLSSSRYLCRLDGTVMGLCNQTNPDRFIDTNCMMFTSTGFHLLDFWGLMPSYAHLIGDRVMLQKVIISGVQRAHTYLPTVYYRCSKEGIYRSFGESIPEGVSKRPDYESSFRKWVEDGNPEIKY